MAGISREKSSGSNNNSIILNQNLKSLQKLKQNFYDKTKTLTYFLILVEGPTMWLKFFFDQTPPISLAAFGKLNATKT